MTQHTVLVVDDTPDIRDVIRLGFLGDDRFEIVGEAEDGQQAIDLVEKLQPDFVVLDLLMPRMSGLDALPGIRAASPLSKVVVLTALSMGDPKVDEALERGAVTVVPKASEVHNVPEILAKL